MLLMGITITQQLPQAQKIGQKLYMSVESIVLDAYTVNAGGFSHNPPQVPNPLWCGIILDNSGYTGYRNMATDKIQLFAASGSHNHSVALDGGVTAAEEAHTHPVTLDTGDSAAGSAHSHGVIETTVGNENSHTHPVALDSGESATENAHTHSVELDSGTSAEESTHTHAIALDSGVSDSPSATGDFPCQLGIPFAGIQNALTAGATCYIGPTDNAENANEDICFVAPLTGDIYGMFATLGNAPAGGESVTLTLRVNGSDSAITFAIADTATAGNDTVHTVPVTAGDKITIKSVATNNGSFAGADLNVSIIYRVDTGAIGAPTADHTHGPGTLADAASEAGSAHSHGPGTLADAASGAGSAHSHGPGTLADAASGAGSVHTHSLTSVETATESAHTHGPGTLGATASDAGSSHTHGPGTLSDAATGAGSVGASEVTGSVTVTMTVITVGTM
jgi:hypothetical protein